MTVRIFDSCNTGNDIEYSCYGAFWAGQVFKPSETYFITKVKLYCRKVVGTTITGDIVVSIRELRENTYQIGSDIIEISGTDLANATITGSDITWSSLAWKEFLLPHSILLSTNTLYAIIWKATNAIAGSPFVYSADITSPSYTRGYQINSGNSGSSWAFNSSRDNMFETYGTGDLILSGSRSYKEINPISRTITYNQFPLLFPIYWDNYDTAVTDKTDINISRSHKELISSG